MTKMDAFVSAMKVAFSLSNEVEGISKIYWNIVYEGSTESTKEIAEKMTLAMQETGVKTKESES